MDGENFNFTPKFFVNFWLANTQVVEQSASSSETNWH